MELVQFCLSLHFTFNQRGPTKYPGLEREPPGAFSHPLTPSVHRCCQTHHTRSLSPKTYPGQRGTCQLQVVTSLPLDHQGAPIISSYSTSSFLFPNSWILC